MLVDNFLKTIAYIGNQPSPEGVFYFIQILQRGKDINKTGSKLIKTYCISDINTLLSYKEEIITLCNTFNARAYIHLTPRSYTEVSKKMLQKLVENLGTENDKHCKRMFESVTGALYPSNLRTWVVDWDYDKDGDDYISCRDHITYLCKPYSTIKIAGFFDTPNGIHLISTPFNIDDFKMKYPAIDVHKNNPTILYANII